MASRISLAVQLRDPSTTPRALRRAKIVPAVIYGHRFDPRSLQAPYGKVAHAVRLAGANRLVSLSIEGDNEAETVLVREVQRDPVDSRIVHVDFYRIISGQKITSSVPLVRQGEAPATQIGGMVNLVLEELEIECLPRDIPEWLPVDIGGLEGPHSRLTVADLTIPENVTVLTPASTDVVRIAMPRKLEPEEIEEVELELGIAAEEGELAEGEEGEAAPEAQDAR